MVDKKRIATVVQTLKDAYPKARIVLRYSTPWELLVAVMLSAQCTDVTVNKVTEKLFAKYKTVDAYVGADLTEFEQDIKSTGFYHNKAKNVLVAAKLIQTKFNGTVPSTMEEMLTIPGVARKTANVVLGNAYGVVVGIAVDTHVSRLSQRLRLVDLTKIGGKKLMIFERGGKVFIEYTKDADPVKIEKELMAIIPKKDWFRLTYLLIDHGRAVCRAQNPNCAGCMVSRLCPSFRLQV
ncbi:MAG: endonuclease III [Candidatus Gottesmanbacteria bacterium]|nr:endonuclease III [Candidatus Gottesmanbacteria bacterium]